MTPSDVKLVKSIECSVGVELSELEVKDEEVADILTQVTVTRREQVSESGRRRGCVSTFKHPKSEIFVQFATLTCSG